MSAGPRLLALTPGDPEGIGPEVTWKAIRSLPKRGRPAILCVGARAPFQKLKAPVTELTEAELGHRVDVLKRILSSRSPRIWLLPAPTETNRHLPGFQSGWSIARAVALVQNKIADALVTGPISKDRLNQGGYPYPGHTEFLSALSTDLSGNAPPVTMMLANDQLRISLVTVHTPLAKVPELLRADELRRAISQTADFLKNRLGIRRPKIAVAALNPHAGENGLLGREERDVIAPEIERFQKQEKGLELSGPHPADTLFAMNRLAPRKARFDAVVCMYHDQGLIPVKLLDFKNTVNITLGLPWIRTSVDHGVAFDLAGKGRADPSSMRAAIALAVKLSSSP